MPICILIAWRICWRATKGLIVALGVIGLIAVTSRGATIPSLAHPASTAKATPSEPSSSGALGLLAGGIVLAFLLGIASLGLYTYLLPITSSTGLGAWGFALVWAWGIGGVVGSWAAGRLLDHVDGHRLLVVSPVLLTAAFLTLWLTRAPTAWFVATLICGVAGWASVAIGQAAYTSVRPERSVQVVAWLMSAMYIGSATGSALGSGILATGSPAVVLPAWALVASGGAAVLATIATITLRRRPASSEVRVSSHFSRLNRLCPRMDSNHRPTA